MSTSSAISSRATQSSKSVAALGVATLWPVYFVRNKGSLDLLHFGLIQLLILLVFLLDPLKRLSPPTPAAPTPVEALPPPPATSATAHRKKGKRALPPPPPPSLYSPALLDTTLSNFLSITEPAFTSLLPAPLPSDSKVPAQAALSTWTVLYAVAPNRVLQHPSTKSLYAIQAEFEDVPLRNLFETLCDVEQRSKWDSMCSGVEKIDEVEVGGRKGSVAWLGMKGMAVIKAKDMVLLSVVSRLPEPTDIPEGETSPLRLFCGTTSFDHPKYPAKPEFNRMHLGVSGFLAEEGVDGKGSRVTQITDLSGLGSWVPGAVIRTVTQTMIPKSLLKLGRAASAWIPTSSQFPLEGNDWLPPLLGSSDDTPVPLSSSFSSDAGSEFGDSDSEEDDLPISSHDVQTLLTQIRSLTTRLSALEAPANGSTRKSWLASLPGMAGTEQMTMSAGLGVVTALAAAGGAAAAVALVGAWGRRRR